MDRSAITTRLRAAGCVFAEDEAALLVDAAADPEELTALVDRRVSGVPLEHLLGWAEFCGLRIEVDDAVFVPRRRTGFLARQAIELARDVDGRPVVLDLCCGSGAVAAVVAAELAEVELHAAELDPAAVRCARRNVPADCPVYEGDLFAALPSSLRGRVDVLVANVPYVPSDSVDLMPPEARLHEPRAALDGGDDGLDVARRVAAEARDWLAPDGHLLIEINDEQAPAALAAFAAGGLTARTVTSDSDYASVVIGTAPSTPTSTPR
jgi:release factor glutamine methyltransferase